MDWAKEQMTRKEFDIPRIKGQEALILKQPTVLYILV